jgi:hypothetical protein
MTMNHRWGKRTAHKKPPRSGFRQRDDNITWHSKQSEELDLWFGYGVPREKVEELDKVA